MHLQGLTSLYTVPKGKSVNMMAMKNASKVNDTFKPLTDKGKLTDWYHIDLNLLVKLLQDSCFTVKLQITSNFFA